MKWIIFILIGFVLVAMVSIFSNPVTNDVSTDNDPHYRELRPLITNSSFDESFAICLDVATSMPGWTITSQDKGSGVINATAVTTFLRFTDDVTITVTKERTGSSIHMRSKSRIGKTDFGANARRIITYLARVESRLKQ